MNLINNKIQQNTYLVLTLWAFAILAICLTLVAIFGFSGLIVSILLSGLLIVLTYAIQFQVPMKLIGFSIYALSLILLDNAIQYIPIFEVGIAIPFFFTVIIILSSNHKRISQIIIKEVVKQPIFLLIIWSSIVFLFSIFLNRDNLLWVGLEYFHILLYGSYFFFLFYFRKADFAKTNQLLLNIFIFISISYVGFNIAGDGRFVTFQSSFLPIFIMIFLSIIVIKNDIFSKKILWGTIFLILLLGMLSTQTRGLWLVSFIGTFIVLYVRFIANRSSIVRFVFILSVIAGVSLVSYVFISNFDVSGINKPEERLEALNNPLADVSLLMRVELSLYAFQEFVKSPFIGMGFGAFIHYKIFQFTTLPQFYIDNSFAYILWKTGLIGLAIFIYFLLSLLNKARWLSLNSNPDKRPLFIGLWVGVIAFILLGFISPVWFKYTSNILIAYLAAFIDSEYANIKLKTV